MATNPKTTHYSTQLHSVIVRGAWSEANPAKAANGTAVPWSELLRKFKKHIPTRSVLADVASHTQALSLLLAASAPGTKEPNPVALDGDDDPELAPLLLGDDCTLGEERMDEAKASLAELEKLAESASSQDADSVQYARAYYEYALARPDECLRIIAEIGPGSTSSSLTTSSLAVPPSVTTTNRSSWSSQMSTVDEEIREGKSWSTIEQIRARCLEGMCHERRGAYGGAWTAYESALPFFLQLPFSTSEPQANPTAPYPKGTGSASSSVFARFRELFRWVERILWRAIIVSAKTRTVEETLPVLRMYSSLSFHYPPTFRPWHRHTVASLHLRALILTKPPPASPTAPSTPTATRPTVRTGPTKLAWVTEARTVIEDYRMVLHHSTRFPKAAERNSRVEEFVDYVVEAWIAAGEDGNDSRWVIDILWWATRLTFHSQRIFRHLTRLLHAAGDDDIAKRTMKLYVQLVTKAKQAGLDQVEDTVRRSRTMSLPPGSSPKSAVFSTTEPRMDEPANGGDSDRNFIQTLIFGARMLCRLSGGIEEAKIAGEYVTLAKETLKNNRNLSRDVMLEARLLAAEGIWKGLLAIRESEPLSDAKHLPAAVALLKQSTELNPTSADAQFHLAFVLATAGPTRDLAQAVLAARQAVELDAKEVRYWHLLGLILSAQGDFAGAKAVLEFGEGVEEEVDNENETVEGEQDPNTTAVTNAQRSDSPTGAPNTLVFPTDTHLPSPAELQSVLPDHPPSSKQQTFEYGLNLRMTLLAVLEMTEGAESTTTKWLEVFAWFAERGGWAVGMDRPLSIDFTAFEHHLAEREVNPSESEPGHAEALDPSHKEEDGLGELPTLRITRSHSPPNPEINVDPPTPGGAYGEDTASASTHRQSITRNGGDKPEKGGGVPGDPAKNLKKAQRVLKEQVTKGQSQLHSISKRIAKDISKGGSQLKRPGFTLHRSTSAPDFHAVLNSSPYQASSIHSRNRLVSPIGTIIRRPRDYSPVSISPPPPPPPLPPPEPAPSDKTPRERRLLSNLWLNSAATFRRMDKIEQARVAIQEAEVLDEGNEGVWVQHGLNHVALGNTTDAIKSFHKALVISPDHVAALVHLCRVYLSPSETTCAPPEQKNVDLAAGLLANLITGPGRDIPEAWYLYAKACGLQGRKQKERESLVIALEIVEGRAVRDIWDALGGYL